MLKSQLILLAALLGAVFLSACAKETPEQLIQRIKEEAAKADRDAKFAAGEAVPYGQVTMPDGAIVQVYEAKVNGSRYVLFPGFSTQWNCGKGCTRRVVTGALTTSGTLSLEQTALAISGMAKLSTAEREALGLTALEGARLSGLAKLTPEERAALGVGDAGSERILDRHPPQTPVKP